MELEETQFSLIPKGSEQARAKEAKNGRSSPYSCLISTLADDEADYNYWNRAFWLEFPEKVIKEANGKVVMRAIALGSEHAGSKAGSWQGVDNVVRVAQCLIPDSPLAVELLEAELRKFSEGTWISNRRGKLASPSTSGWECGEYFVTIVCQVDPNTHNWINCMITDVTCVSYVYVEEPIGGGGGGGFPSEEPGQCDGLGSEVCYEGPGGGQPIPDPPNPCNQQNPPIYCTTPCSTTNSMINTVPMQLAKEKYWKKSYGPEANPLPHDQRNEINVFVVESGNTYEFIELSPTSVSSCHWINPAVRIPSNLVAIIHTHPFAPGESITDQRCLTFRGWPSGPPFPIFNPSVSTGDMAMVSVANVPLIVLDKEKIRVLLPSQPNQYTNVFDRCGF